jgi:S1-C subfamily serine protease
LTDADRPDHPLSFAALGIVLVPDVVSRTPPYVDRVLPGSAADKAGLRPDDLLVMIDANVVASRQQADSVIERFEKEATVRVSVLRDETLVEVSLSAAAPTEPAAKE